MVVVLIQVKSLTKRCTKKCNFQRFCLLKQSQLFYVICTFSETSQSTFKRIFFVSITITFHVAVVVGDCLYNLPWNETQQIRVTKHPKSALCVEIRLAQNGQSHHSFRDVFWPIHFWPQKEWTGVDCHSNHRYSPAQYKAVSPLT